MASVYNNSITFLDKNKNHKTEATLRIYHTQLTEALDKTV